MIDELKSQGEWKIQITIAINFFPSKDSNETCTIHAKSDSIEIMIGNETDEIIEELFDSPLERSQEKLEQSMRGYEVVFDSVDLMYYKCRKISLNRGRSYMDSPEWLKNKKATINPKNNDDKCFQYSTAAALNLEKIESHPERISNIKGFVNQYSWKEIDVLSHKNDWKKFEKIIKQ